MVIDKSKLDAIRAKKAMRLSDLGVSKTTISRISNELPLKPITVGKIANSLDCSVEEIIEKEE